MSSIQSRKPRSGYQTADEFYEEYYRYKAREDEKKQTARFGGGPFSLRKQNVGLLIVFAAAVGAITFWNKNQKRGTRLGKEPQKPAARQGLSAKEAASQAAHKRHSGAGTSHLTPLGKTLAVAQKVDQFEAEARTLQEKVRGAGKVENDNKKEQSRLIELVTQAQIEMDCITVDESARALKKAQIVRMDRIITSLENLAEYAHKHSTQTTEGHSSRKEEDEGPS